MVVNNMNTLTIPEKLIAKIRYCIDKDLPTLEHIDTQSKHGWAAADFKKYRKIENTIALVADIGDTPVAYCMMELTEERAKIERLAVSLLLRRRSIGSQLVDKIKNGFLKKGRHCIYVEIDEYNIGAQLFLRRNEFRANEIMPQYGYDYYKMEYFK